MTVLPALPGTDHGSVHTYGRQGKQRQRRPAADRNGGVVSSSPGKADKQEDGKQELKGRTAFALAEQQELDDVPLLSEGSFAFDILVYFVAYAASLCLLSESLDSLLWGLAGRGLQRGVEGVGRFAGGHCRRSSRVVKEVVVAARVRS